MRECPTCSSPVDPPRTYCNKRCKRAAERKRSYAANYKSLGLFVPGIMKATKEHTREWGYT